MDLNGRAGEDQEKEHCGNWHQNGTATPLIPDQREYGGKEDRIRAACQAKDTNGLRTLATSEGGLLTDEARREAWPLLLGHGVESDDEHHPKLREDWKQLPSHDDEDQVRLDVDRSFIYYPNDQSSYQLNIKKAELSDLITETLRRQPYLRYFQGYHDICQVLLLVLPAETRTIAIARLSTLRIRDFMLPTLAPALAQLRLIPAIIYTVDPKLCHHLSQTQPFFALSGTLTMYAHDIQEYGDIARLFDVLLAREAMFSVYMFAQIVLSRSDELFETPADEPEMLHSILSKLPKPLDLESLISRTVHLMEKHPPEQLRGWSLISRYSVLKTARWPDQATTQSMEDGKTYFNQQVKELEWAEKRQRIFQTTMRFSKPAGKVGLAIVVGVLAYWLRKQSGSLGIFETFWRSILGHR